MTKQDKEQALEILSRRYAEQKEQVTSIDPRLADYYEGLIEEPQFHNGDELLCAVKLLRLMRTYEVDADEVQRTLHVFEGEWEKDSRGMWRHISGGVKQPGRQGPEVYRFEPFQVFVFTAVSGIQGWIDPELTTADRSPTATERVTEDGRIEDLRRLCVRFICYMPRKTNKTGLSAINGARDFMLGDDDAQVVCCANSQDQSKILFARIGLLLSQFDPQGKRIRFTATEINWKPGQMRSASVYAMSAGGKNKDGLFASSCLPDEYGSAGYTNGKSDMGNLVKVIESSMGPRREGLTFITTTAGNIQTGPFVELLDATRIGLLAELKFDTGEETATVANDRWMGLLLKPDDWECEEETLFTDRNLRRKVNPMLGKIVQHSFYEQAIADSRLDPITKRETITKLFNVYQSASMTEWIKPEQVRALQVDRRIDQCTAEDGWIVYACFDFSHGDDFDAISYLAFNIRTREYFADCDAWVNEEAFNSSPYHPLYVKWRDDRWLHVSGKTTVAPEAPITRIMELDSKGINFIAFGYDAYQSKEPILLLNEWLYNEVGMAKPETIVVPVSQTFATYNAAVQKIDYCMAGVVTLRFSPSPLWPWEFSNCVLEEDTRMGNKKPLKRSANCKVDNIQCLCSCFVLEEKFA